MCDDGEGFRYMAHRRRSRKRRWCHACNEAIAAGEHYVRIVAFGYGYADYTPQCDRCHAIFNALARMKPGEAIRFDLDCGTYIEDEDHPLQWLAYALPPRRFGPAAACAGAAGALLAGALYQYAINQPCRRA